MFGQVFYHSTIRKYVILVGTLFNDIHIQRKSATGDRTVLMKVPITYGPKDKMIARIMQNPGSDRPTATATLPMISFEMGQMKYDGSRKLQTINRSVVKSDDSSKFRYQYNPVPYNIDFKAYVYAKNAEDGTKIIEQILPYFTPDWTTTVKLIPEMEIIMDVPVVLNSISYSDNYDETFLERRAIIWTLDLTLKGYIYGPVKKSAIIKFVDVPFRIPDVPDGKLSDAVGVTPVAERVTVQPGLTVDGKPTSNIEITIPYREIEVDDDYGFITRILNE